MINELFTIGVYGFEAEEFFARLTAARVDTFVDIRQRRSMRGSRYAFANATALERRLTDLGISYIHAKSLAPPNWVRDLQREADLAQKTKKGARKNLSPRFVEEYTKSCLATADLDLLIKELESMSTRVAFFCVEREPQACHRSIVAEEIRRRTDHPVGHLMP